MKVKDVIADLNRRMAEYTHSMQPSNDEVAMALLICHMQEMQEVIDGAFVWWAEHKHDTKGNYGDHNVFDEVPEFIALAKKFMEGSRGVEGSDTICGGANACINTLYDKTSVMCQNCTKEAYNAVEVTITEILR